MLRISVGLPILTALRGNLAIPQYLHFSGLNSVESASASVAACPYRLLGGGREDFVLRDATGRQRMGGRSRGLPVPPFDSTAAVVVEAGQAEHAARAQLPVQCAQGRRWRQRRPGPGGGRNALHGNTRQRVSAAEVLVVCISQGMIH